MKYNTLFSFLYSVP